MCVVCACLSVCTTFLWGRKMPSGPMELQSVVSHPMWVLGSKPSAKGTSACNYWAISPASHKKMYFMCVSILSTCMCVYCVHEVLGGGTDQKRAPSYISRHTHPLCIRNPFPRQLTHAKDSGLNPFLNLGPLWHIAVKGPTCYYGCSSG